MSTLAIVVIVVVIVAVAAVAAAVVLERRRSRRLQHTFGPEYGRTVEQAGDRRAGERELHEREKRRSRFEVTRLGDAEASRYRGEWMSIQGRFVDDPAEAVRRADSLVVRMMRDSGYPVDDFEHRVDDISVDHPDVAEHYREAHAEAVAQLDGTADTEELRHAVTSYRALVDALLPDGDSGPHGATQS